MTNKLYNPFRVAAEKMKAKALKLWEVSYELRQRNEVIWKASLRRNPQGNAYLHWASMPEESQKAYEEVLVLQKKEGRFRDKTREYNSLAESLDELQSRLLVLFYLRENPSEVCTMYRRRRWEELEAELIVEIAELLDAHGIIVLLPKVLKPKEEEDAKRDSP